jgi:hypothetical protein
MRGLACTAAGAWALLRAAVVGALGLALVELLAQKVTEVGLQKQEEQARACTSVRRNRQKVPCYIPGQQASRADFTQQNEQGV